MFPEKIDAVAPDAYRTPVYQQIADQIREQVRSGFLREGDRVPSLPMLRAEWNVATMTVRQAIDQLADLVAVCPGFTVVSIARTVEAPPLVALLLRVAEGDPVWVRMVEGRVVFEHIQA